MIFFSANIYSKQNANHNIQSKNLLNKSLNKMIVAKITAVLNANCLAKDIMLVCFCTFRGLLFDFFVIVD